MDEAKKIGDKALELGFHGCGIVPIGALQGFDGRLDERIRECPGSKTILEPLRKYAAPDKGYPWAGSVIVTVTDHSRYRVPESLEGRIGRYYLFDHKLQPQAPGGLRIAAFERELDGMGIRWAKELHGVTSLRWAAEKSGLGMVRRNNFLYTAAGSLVLLDAWAIDRGLERSQTRALPPCPSDCRRCVDACPFNRALPPCGEEYPGQAELAEAFSLRAMANALRPEYRESIEKAARDPHPKVREMAARVLSAVGGLAATMDSPDQGAKGIPVSSVDVQGDAVTLSVKAAAASYAGKMSADGRNIEGAWNQGGASFPVLLQKQDAPFALVRPQEPKPPFPYASIDVQFRGLKPGVTLAGTITVPQGRGPFPAVVLVTGSGPQNRDEELMGHKPFAVIADFLARSGIAALRYDDRGAGGSKGDNAAATTLDFADDAEAAFRFLAARSEVDPKRVGIAGHSEGGLIGPIVAARNPAVAFLVLLAGPGLRGDIATVAAEIRKAYLEGIDSNQALSATQKEEARKNVNAAIAPLVTPWYRAFLALDPADFLSKVRVPVLALNGSKDLAAIGTALRAAGNHSYKLLKLDGLNHLFQHAGTGLPDEYGQITETFAPEALAAMRDWILGR